MRSQPSHGARDIAIDRITEKMVEILRSQHGGFKGVYCGDTDDDLVIRMLGAQGAINRRKFRSEREREDCLRQAYEQLKTHPDVYYEKIAGRVVIQVSAISPVPILDVLPTPVVDLFVNQDRGHSYDDLSAFESRYHRVLQGAL